MTLRNMRENALRAVSSPARGRDERHHLPGDLAVHGVHEMRDHRRRCSARWQRSHASKPDRIALGMSPRGHAVAPSRRTGNARGAQPDRQCGRAAPCRRIFVDDTFGLPTVTDIAED
jgi:hypothetical protein